MQQRQQHRLAAAGSTCSATCACIGRHLANKNEMRVSASESYALLFLLWLHTVLSSPPPCAPVNYEAYQTEYSISMTAQGSYGSCGPFDPLDLRKMLLGSGEKWRSSCRKGFTHTLVIGPNFECSGTEWVVERLAFKLSGTKKVEVYLDEKKIYQVSSCRAIYIVMNNALNNNNHHHYHRYHTQLYSPKYGRTDNNETSKLNKKNN